MNRKPREAQAEFALILGLLAIAIVVAVFVYYAFAPTPVQPSSLTEEQKAVDAYVKDAVGRASARTLATIYDQGGYVDLSGKRVVDYAGNDIAYWQLCENTDIPDVEQNLEAGIEQLLQTIVPPRTDIAGKIVTFDKAGLDVDAKIYDNSITVDLKLPTVVEGQAMPQPYTINVDSRLGRISQFAGDFADFQASYRALDYNLVRMIRRSNPRYCWLPTKGVLFKSSFYKSWGELRYCMEEMIIHTLAHTYGWDQPVLRDGKLANDMLPKSWVFEVQKSDGSWGQYSDLDIEFSYGGEDKSLSRSDPELYFNTNPSPVRESGDSFSLIGGSIGPMLAYDVTYDVSFPVIVSVWDHKMQRSFKFSAFVNIRENDDSDDCSFKVGVPDQGHQHCVYGATQYMHLTVNDQDGKAMSGVDVWYDGCGPWRAFYGDLRTYIPPATDGELRLVHEFSGSEFTTCIDSGQLAERTMTFPVRQSYGLEYFLVVIRRDIVSGYRISSIGRTLTENISVQLSSPGARCSNGSIATASNYDSWGGISYRGFADMYPSVTYTGAVSTDTSSIDIDDLSVGSDTRSLYVYAPYVIGGTESDLSGVEQLYEKCGMDPVSGEFYSGKVGCTLR